MALLLLFGYAFSWVFAFFGLIASSPEAAQALGFIIVFPLTFVSSAFVPVDSMPTGCRPSPTQPVHDVVDAMRSLFLGTPAGNNVWGAVAWCFGITAVFGPLSASRYRRAVVR